MTRHKMSDALPRVDLRGAFLRRTDLSRASLRDANLSGADFTRAIFREADLRGAQLTGTVLHGADLTFATNLTIDQLASAIIDEDTLLPDYIDRLALLRRLETLSPARALN